MDDSVKQYLSDMGKKGGSTTLQRKGKDWFKEISKKGVEARRQKNSQV